MVLAGGADTCAGAGLGVVVVGVVVLPAANGGVVVIARGEANINRNGDDGSDAGGCWNSLVTSLTRSDGFESWNCWCGRLASGEVRKQEQRGQQPSCQQIFKLDPIAFSRE